MQLPENHTNGEGCPHCKAEKIGNLKRKSIDKLLHEFNEVHGVEIYDYSLFTTYKNNKQKITIICPIHGEFKQRIFNHLINKQGCPMCGDLKVRASIKKQTSTKEKFINDARKIHGISYDYNEVDYINNYTKITIICPIHGEFKQRPLDHVISHNGCSLCAKRSYSKSAISWLIYISNTENIHIQHAENGGEYRIPNTRYFVDGYCKENNTVYEFHGDAYHGNLTKYTPETLCHPFKNNITAQELHDKTMIKEKIIRELGYNLISIWESDWNVFINT
jgi:Protein of unknown function (DUF723)